MNAVPETRLPDVEAIKAVIVGYCRGVDRGDAELISAAYHADAKDEHGDKSFTGATVGRGLVELTEPSRVSLHQVMNQTIEFTGPETAGSETYFTAWLRREGEQHLMLALGRYLDQFERRDGEWKIARRLVVVDATQLVPSAASMEPSRPGLGSRSRKDPSYAFLRGEVPTVMLDSAT